MVVGEEVCLDCGGMKTQLRGCWYPEKAVGRERDTINIIIALSTGSLPAFQCCMLKYNKDMKSGKYRAKRT